MTPNVLCIGPWVPDSPWRFFCDALQYCGCRVVRAGPQLFGRFPPDERPPVHTFGVWEPRAAGEPVEVAPFAIQDLVHGCLRQGFEPHIVLLNEALVLAAKVTGKLPAGARLVPWKPVVGCDPYVHAWLNHGERTVKVFKEQDYRSIREYVQALNEAQYRHVVCGSREQYEAAACGCVAVVFPPEPERYPGFAESMRNTYWHRAREFLDQQGYEPSMPRLWL